MDRQALIERLKKTHYLAYRFADGTVGYCVCGQMLCPIPDLLDEIARLREADVQFKEQLAGAIMSLPERDD